MKRTTSKGKVRRAARAGGMTIPPDYQRLMETGVLRPEPNGMKCARCGEPVALLLNREPGIEKGKTIRGSVWGKDVSVICRCCSFPHCTHKQA